MAGTPETFHAAGRWLQPHFIGGIAVFILEVAMPKALVLGGSTGLLGQALMSALGERGWRTLALGRKDGDLLDPGFMRERLLASRPDAVFNTVAWTQVDDAEDHQDEAMEINRALPDSLARIIFGMENTWLAHFSTDFVFSGEGSSPWKETDAPEPKSVYGSTKLAGEEAVREILPNRSCIIRTAWLFGPGRKNFVDTILRASRSHDSLNVVDDQFGSPTYTPDLAKWSAALAERRAVGLWHGVNSGRASWCELAAEAISLSSSSCRITPITSAEWPQKARRPAYSVLDNAKLAGFLGEKPRPWQKALREYLFERHAEPSAGRQ